jgi:predicted fused transcriptional regulator/phosphomethylpyrimidine kinase
METDSTRADRVLTLCKGCFRIREGGSLCTFHGIENCNACSRLRYGDLTEEKMQVIKDIREALKLLETNDVFSLAPQVNMNIAQASRGSENRTDVASIPGRITFIRGKPRPPSPPEFGSSNHLSRLILGVMQQDKDTRSVMNIKFDKEVEQALKNTDLGVVEYNRKKGEIFEFVTETDVKDVIIDKGDFGIEPCTYVLGHNAVDVIKKVIKLAREVNGKRT